MEYRKPGQDPFQEAKKIASSPAGQELIRLLQQTGGEELNQAVAKAASGDYTQAKEKLTALLNNPDAQKLLQQLGR